MSTPLSEVLNAETENKPEVAAEAVETTDEAEVKTEVEKTDVVTEEAAPSAAETKPDEPDVKQQIEDLRKELNAQTVRAKDERSKRQALEQQNLKPAEKISIFDDEDAALSQREQQIMSHFTGVINNLTEDMARQTYPDYDEKYEVFEQLTQTDPSLLAGLRGAVNPARFVYDTAKKHLDLQKVQSLDNVDEAIDLAQQIKTAGGLDKWKTLQLEGLKEQLIKDKLDQTVQNIPGSLADATAAAGTKGQTWSGPTPLNKVIGK